MADGHVPSAGAKRTNDGAVGGYGHKSQKVAAASAGRGDTWQTGAGQSSTEPNPNAKRKVALLIAYNGARYAGLQKNPGVETIEEVLEVALNRAGAISDENLGVLQKVSWSRAGRTDKGVHALGQIISAKLVLAPDGLIERINAQLTGSDIVVLAMERVTGAFCAHTHCESREYEYLLPVSALRMATAHARAAHNGDDDAIGTTTCGGRGGGAVDASIAPASTASDGLPRGESAEQPLDKGDEAAGGGAAIDGVAPLSPSERERLESLLQAYRGTHSFHNFTDGKLSHTDKSATRYMMKLSLGPPLTIAARPYVTIRLHGQSFLLHQIRKMVSLVVAAFAHLVDESTISEALTRPKVAPIPLAPSCALTLRACHYNQYERKRAADRNSIHFPQCAAAKDAFLVEHILPHVARAEAEGDFGRFAAGLRKYQLHAPAEVAAQRERGDAAPAAAAEEQQPPVHDAMAMETPPTATLEPGAAPSAAADA